MSTKWDLFYCPGQNDSNRWQLKLVIEEDRVMSLIAKLPGKRGRPFLLSESGYDFGLYLYEINEESFCATCKVLLEESPFGQVFGPSKQNVFFPVMEKIARETGLVVFNTEKTECDSVSANEAGLVDKTNAADSSSSEKQPMQYANDKNTSPVRSSYDETGLRSGNSDDAFRDMELNQGYIFDEFIIGPSNRFTAAAAHAVADNLAKIYNPFFIYGGVGLGKTHLMHAVGNYVKNKNPEVKILYVTTEKFMSDVIDSIRQGSLKNMRDHYRKADLLLVDDIQFLEESESTQEEFFHTFNALHQSGKQIIITCDRPPKRLTTLADRLRSRFEWGLIADIKSPNLETRVAILKKKEKYENLNLDDNMLLYIASKLKSNIRELEGFLKRINAYASLTKQEVNMDLVKSIMADLLPEDEADEQLSTAKLGGPAVHTPVEPVMPKNNPKTESEVYVIKTPLVNPAQIASVPLPASSPEEEQVFKSPSVPVLKDDEIVIVKKNQPAAQPPAHSALPEQRSEILDGGLKPVEVAFFYPDGKNAELDKVKERFKDVIRKHKLKFRLVGLVEKTYVVPLATGYDYFVNLCKENNASVALVLGPPPAETPDADEDFTNNLSSIMEDAHISLQLIPWTDINKDYRYLNLALDITLLKHRA